MKIELLFRVSEIFDKKNWEIEEEIVTSKYNLFCEMLELLKDDDEKNLLLELLEDFLHLNAELYSKRIINGIKSMLKSKSSIKDFFILPLLAENDINKIKSSHHIHYLFRGTTFKHKISAFQDKGISIIDDLNHIQLGKLKDNQHIVIVDDFVGTGETAKSAINYLLKVHPNLSKKNISVLTIVIQKSGIETLTNEGISFFYSISVGKGISDKYPENEKQKKIDIMRKIEGRLKGLKPEFNFGYMESEALVCMERTPNNTFPIFWYNKKNINIAPFPR